MFSRKSNFRRRGFTLVEVMVATAMFSLFAAAAISTWTTLETSALNTKSYAQRQNDQMRVVDYLKRDIRRAWNIDIYNGTNLVAGTASGTELRVTVPIYYTDSRLEDDAAGANVANAPTISAGVVSYGSTRIVRYYVLNGAVIRNEAGTAVTITDAAGNFTLSFAKQVGGDVLSTVNYSQSVSSWNHRTLNRTVTVLSGQRSLL